MKILFLSLVTIAAFAQNPSVIGPIDVPQTVTRLYGTYILDPKESKGTHCPVSIGIAPHAENKECFDLIPAQNAEFGLYLPSRTGLCLKDFSYRHKNRSGQFRTPSKTLTYSNGGYVQNRFRIVHGMEIHRHEVHNFSDQDAEKNQLPANSIDTETSVQIFADQSLIYGWISTPQNNGEIFDQDKRQADCRYNKLQAYNYANACPGGYDPVLSPYYGLICIPKQGSSGN